MFSSKFNKFLVIASALLLLSACSGSTTTDTGSNITYNNNDNGNQNTPNTQSNSTGVVTLNWLPPTENTDDTVLSDLSGYKLYFGLSPSSLTTSITINNPGITTYLVENLNNNSVYYFTMTSINSSGIESEYSNVVTKLPI